MLNTYITTKVHMNQVWDKGGIRKAITILKTEPGTIVQVKTVESDGYNALVVGFGSQKESRLKQPQIKYYKKNKIESFPKVTREVKVENPNEYKIGDTLTADQIFSIGDVVNAQGITKGKGFTGVIKRWGFHGGPRTHGQSDRERAPGSIGQGTDPGRVHRGKKMPGHHGNQTRTIKNLTIFNITKDEIWVSGPVPGSIHSLIMLTKVGTKDFAGLMGIQTETKEVSKKVEKPEEKPTEPKDESEVEKEEIKAVKDESEAKKDDKDEKESKE